MMHELLMMISLKNKTKRCYDMWKSDFAKGGTLSCNIDDTVNMSIFLQISKELLYSQIILTKTGLEPFATLE